MQKLLTVIELSEFLGVKIRTLYNWVHEDYIPYVKVGRLLRFDESDIKKWLKRRTNSGRTKHIPEVNIDI